MERPAQGDRRRFVNSYAYAVNDPFRDRAGRTQPGERNGGPSFLADPRSHNPCTGAFRIDIAALQESIARDDQAIFLGTTPASTFSAPYGTYIAALLVDDDGPVQDYIWYRMNADGAVRRLLWSQAEGDRRRRAARLAGPPGSSCRK